MREAIEGYRPPSTNGVLRRVLLLCVLFVAGFTSGFFIPNPKAALAVTVAFSGLAAPPQEARQICPLLGKEREGACFRAAVFRSVIHSFSGAGEDGGTLGVIVDDLVGPFRTGGAGSR